MVDAFIHPQEIVAEEDELNTLGVALAAIESYQEDREVSYRA